jgi:hypothetical protein
LCLFSGENNGNTGESKEIDIEKMAWDILEKKPFAEELVQRELNDLVQYGYIYGFEPKPEKVVSYIGGGATPQELLIIKAANEDDAKTIKTSLESYRDKQIKIYEPYAASEVPNLENATIKRNGACVVYCVAKDDVTPTVNEYMK